LVVNKTRLAVVFAPLPQPEPMIITSCNEDDAVMIIKQTGRMKRSKPCCQQIIQGNFTKWRSII